MSITKAITKSLLLLLMAAPCAAATYTVSSTTDSGPGSLRDAIAAANSTPDNDLIIFDISGCPGSVCTITLTTGELSISTSASAGALTISNPGGPAHLILSGNNASRILRVNSGANLTINGLTLQNGYSQEGGALLNEGSCTVVNSILRLNHAENGGAIKNGGADNDAWGGSLVVIKSEIVNNKADSDPGYGGGIYSVDGPLFMLDSTVAENMAGSEYWISGGFGGGIAMIADNSSFAAVLVNCTISGNRSIGEAGPWAEPGAGGGLFLISDSEPSTFLNVTMANNFAAYGGGVAGIGTYFAPHMFIRNSLVAGNTESHSDPNAFGVTFLDRGNNLVGGSPQLGPLANNGGPTRTHALLPGSPAIDAGNNCVLTENGCIGPYGQDHNPALSFDQRGSARVGTVDIGAFEFAAQPAVFELAGRVTTPTGVAIRGARVILDDRAGNLRFALTNPFGYFRFQNVPTGTYTITARRKGLGAASTVIEVSSSVADLELIL